MAQQVIYRENITRESGGGYGNGGYRAYSASRVIWFLLYVLEAFLAVRFILKAISANAAASFTAFVNNVSQPFINPFTGIIASVRSGRALIEWSTIVAMIVYWLAAYAVIWLLVQPSRNVKSM